MKGARRKRELSIQRSRRVSFKPLGFQGRSPAFLASPPGCWQDPGMRGGSLPVLIAWNEVGTGEMLQALLGVTWVCPVAASSTGRILSCQVAFRMGPAILAEIAAPAFLGLLSGSSWPRSQNLCSQSRCSSQVLETQTVIWDGQALKPLPGVGWSRTGDGTGIPGSYTAPPQEAAFLMLKTLLGGSSNLLCGDGAG